MKKLYIKPEIEIVTFKITDVIAISSDTDNIHLGLSDFDDWDFGDEDNIPYQKIT